MERSFRFRLRSFSHDLRIRIISFMNFTFTLLASEQPQNSSDIDDSIIGYVQEESYIKAGKRLASISRT